MSRYSTNSILAREEIDLLLRGLPETSKPDAGEPSPGHGEEQGKDRIIRGGLPLLERVGENFSVLFSESLRGVLRHRAGVDLVGVDVTRFSELFSSLTRPASITHFRLGGMRGSGSLGMDSTLALGFVEDMLGGGGASSSGRKKGYTAIERSVIELVARMVLDRMNRAWEPLIPTRFSLPEEGEGPFPSYVSSGAVCLRMAFEVGIENLRGALYFCLPMSSLKPHRNELGGSTNPDDSGSWRLNLSHILDATFLC